MTAGLSYPADKCVHELFSRIRPGARRQPLRLSATAGS